MNEQQQRSTTGGRLLDERVVSVHPSLVRALGATQALVVQQIHFHATYDAPQRLDGEQWTPLRQADIADETGLSHDAVHRAVRALEDRGVLITRQPEGSSSRRKWYRLNRELIAKRDFEVAESRSDQVAESRLPSIQRGKGQIEDSSNEEPSLRMPRPPRDSDRQASATHREIFEALCRVCGIDWNDLAPGRARAVGAAARELRALGADPAEIERRAWNYQERFDAALTPSALRNQWAVCRTAPTRVTRQRRRAEDDTNDLIARELAKIEREERYGSQGSAERDVPVVEPLRPEVERGPGG